MIEAKRLTKNYGHLKAVDDVSFAVGPGEVLGFLGPNGAGKSTTMKMLTGFLTPTSGSASICGHDVATQPIAAKACLGYLPEGAPSYDEMTPRSFLRFVADLYGMDKSTRDARIGWAIEHLQLDGVLNQSIETLSKGFRRRVGLAQALLHDPQVLILDEPTDGLDPNQKHEVRELIRNMSADKIIVISTHILEEVNAVCSRVIIVAKGRIVADNTPDELEAQSRYHNAISLGVGDQVDAGMVQQTIEALPGVKSVERDGQRLVAFPASTDSILGAIAQVATTRGWPLHDLQLESGRLDEVFRRITVGGST